MKNNREIVVIRTSIISILSNIVLAFFKAFVGILANSIAIISDAVNNLSDALSSIITIIGIMSHCTKFDFTYSSEDAIVKAFRKLDIKCSTEMVCDFKTNIGKMLSLSVIAD